MKQLWAFLVASVLVTSTFSCSSREERSSPATSPATSGPGVAMPRNLAGMSFISKENLPGSSGKASGPWGLRFKEDVVTWKYGIANQGTYVAIQKYILLSDGTIKVTGDLSHLYGGRYYPERREIFWNGTWYRCN